MHIDDAAGARIKALRLARGRTQADLTGPGLSAPYLSLIESGARRPTVAVLRRLAEVLDTTVEHLAHGADATPAPWREAERRVAFAELATVHASADEALAELDDVLRDCPEPLRDRAELARAKALEALDRPLEALMVYEELEQRAASGSMVWAERCVDIMRCYRRSGDMTSSVEFGERALAAFESLGLEWTTEAVRLGVTLAGKYWKRGDLARARRMIERMLAAAETVGSPLARASALWNAAGIALAQNRRDDALALSERAVVLFGEAEHLLNAAVMRYFYAYILYMTDADVDTARARNAEAREMLREVGSRTDRSRCESLEAYLDLRAGDAHAATARAREAVALAEAAVERNLEVAARAHTALARSLYDLGEHEEAVSELDTAEIRLAAEEQSIDTVEVWQRIADTWEVIGRPDRSIQAYRRALSAAGHASAAEPAPIRRH